MPTDAQRILIVDDELPICLNCQKILSKIDCKVDYALDGYDAIGKLDQAKYHVIVTDLKMSRMGGMELLRRVKAQQPETQVVVITGFASVASAVEVMKIGASDYLPKPFTPGELRAVVQQALRQRRLYQQNRQLAQRKGRASPAVHQLIGSSPKIRQVITMVEKVAPTNSTVLIYGESGTGKELIARAVHANSRRKKAVFFAVDCGTLNDQLLESELFGHRKGAFTGAHQHKDGIFKLADGGTVFLDEISNVSVEVQGKLLRFLETRQFLTLGDTKSRQVDVRLILATNKNLEDMVAQGLFREDFYYRIYVYPIILPPLRDRLEDVLPIAYHFLDLFGSQMGKSVDGFDAEVADWLSCFNWPGNVRQLRNVVERALILCDGNTITPKEVPALNGIDAIEELIERTPHTNAELKAIKKQIRQKAVAKVEKRFLINALTRNDWNVTRAAQATGLQRTNFQKLMRKHAITLAGTRRENSKAPASKPPPSPSDGTSQE